MKSEKHSEFYLGIRCEHLEYRKNSQSIEKCIGVSKCYNQCKEAISNAHKRLSSKIVLMKILKIAWKISLIKKELRVQKILLIW